MQFLVVAKDGTDEGALERRQRTRPTHLERSLRSSKRQRAGGRGDPREAGDMIGSDALVDFPAGRTSTPGSLAAPTSRTGSGKRSRSTRSAPRWAPGSLGGLARRPDGEDRDVVPRLSGAVASTARSMRSTSPCRAPAPRRTAASPSSPNAPPAPRSSVTPSVYRINVSPAASRSSSSASSASSKTPRSAPAAAIQGTVARRTTGGG